MGDLDSIPGLARSPGGWQGNSLQYSCLENPMDCIVHGVAKSRTQLREFHFQVEFEVFSSILYKTLDILSREFTYQKLFI